MKSLSMMHAAGDLLLLGAAVLTVVGPPSMRQRAPQPLAKPAAPALPAISAGNFSLVSERADLPTDDAPLPQGPGLDKVMANCTACHSAAMIANQPRLTHAQWSAIVTKMRTTFHAPVCDEDVADIIAYLEYSGARTHEAESQIGND